jgi:hypothetical protein
VRVWAALSVPTGDFSEALYFLAGSAGTIPKGGPREGYAGWRASLNDRRWLVMMYMILAPCPGKQGQANAQGF